ncbi:multicopper oxidase family protein [Streptomyces sp. NBC_01537]|uniref:multicopper oxidase family protein n=1 Tax=Streptomyces sp. NBC_01537 TaxID=2903896 RepID=UPI00386B77AC
MAKHTHTRRSLLALGGAAALTACTRTAYDLTDDAPAPGSGFVSPDGPEVAAAERGRATNGTVREVRLTAVEGPVELGGGRSVRTWSYGGEVPGREIRLTAGDTLAATLTNHLPDTTSAHWHGLALRNDMDGVPDLTQPPIGAGAEFSYRFAVERPGTYWFHPHTGVQLDRGLYAPLIVADPREPMPYDKEWTVVLDDWLDGIDGSTPDSVMAELMGGPAARPSRMLTDAKSMLLGGDTGHVAYPLYLINGRTPDDPSVFAARPGDRIRIRFINAGGDSPFRVALGGHRMTVTHTDGFPVSHADTDALLIGMGERYDVLVTAGDGVFPLTALAEGKDASALAVLRTSPGGAVPVAGTRPAELDGVLVTADRLRADESVRLPDPGRAADRTVRLTLTGSMDAHDWAFDRQPYDHHHSAPHAVRAGERVRIEFANHTRMWHPVHLHGHTFSLGRDGARKDTAVVLPGQSLSVDLDADNPGLWMLHCHNIYHSEAGMMTVLGYQP